jgi:hypothetical protein
MIRFVPHKPPRGKTVRDRELENAAIKSHAAKVSYKPSVRSKARVKNPVYELKLRPPEAVEHSNPGSEVEVPLISTFSTGQQIDADDEQDSMWRNRMLLLTKRLVPPIHIVGIENHLTAGGLEYMLSFHGWDPYGLAKDPKSQGFWLLQQMRIYTDVCHVILALCIGFRRGDRNVPNPFGEPRIFYHRSMAVAELRHRLSLPMAAADDSAIVTMLNLAHLDVLLGDEETADIHRRHSEALIASRGGIEGLKADSHIRNFAALHTPSSPLKGQPAFVSTGYIPMGFQDLASSMLLYPQTLCMVAWLAGCAHECFIKDTYNPTPLTRRALYWPNPFPPSNDQDPEWEQRLVDICPGVCLADKPDGESPFERLLCHTLVCYHFSGLGVEVAAAEWQRPWNMRLWNDLNKTPTPGDGIKREALVWMWLVFCISFMRVADHPSYEVAGIFQRICYIFELHDWTASDVKNLARKFFLSDDLSAMLDEHWNSLRFKSQHPSGVSSPEWCGQYSTSFPDRTAAF